MRQTDCWTWASASGKREVAGRCRVGRAGWVGQGSVGWAMLGGWGFVLLLPPCSVSHILSYLPKQRRTVSAPLVAVVELFFVSSLPHLSYPSLLACRACSRPLRHGS